MGIMRYLGSCRIKFSFSRGERDSRLLLSLQVNPQEDINTANLILTKELTEGTNVHIYL